MTHAATLFGIDPLWGTSGILVLTYAILIRDRLNRAIIALAGAALTIILGFLDQEQAIAGIDFNTIGLLVGMMIIVSVTRKTGLFEYLAIRATKLVKAEPAAVLAVLAVVTALASAFLDNVTTVLLVVPVTLLICESLGLEPFPFLFSEVLASNIGGTATLIGDPPNILIGAQVGISFNDFVTHLAPVVAVVLLVHLVSMHLIWGRHLTAHAEAKAKVMAFDEKKAITDRLLLRKSLGVLAAVIASFVGARYLGLESGAIGLSGAALLLVLDNVGRSPEEQTHNVTRVFNEVEWIVIFFFAGLFVIIAGVEHAGLLKMIAQWLVSLTSGNLTITGSAVLWASAALSAIIDNIPFVATMIPLIKGMAPGFGGMAALMPLWWCLSLGACLGGNATLVGASANLTVAGIAERNGVSFGFARYTRSALGLTVVHIAIVYLYVMWRFF